MASPFFHLFPKNDQLTAKIARAFGHPARIKILRILQRSDESSFSAICGVLPLSRQAVLQHLNYLMSVGLIEGREDPPYSYYRYVPIDSHHLLSLFSQSLSDFLSE